MVLARRCSFRTKTPRKEPLYDRYGRPIVPRPWEDYHRPKKSGVWPFEKDESLAVDMEWMRRVKAAGVLLNGTVSASTPDIDLNISVVKAALISDSALATRSGWS